MARKPDPFWNHAEEMNDGRKTKKCKYCEQIYMPGTSVLRVKYHLSGIPGGGIKRCEKVLDDVKDEAYAAIDTLLRKKLKTAASSSNNEADAVTIPAPLLGQNSEAENGLTDRSPGRALEGGTSSEIELELHRGGNSPGDHMFAETAQQKEMQMQTVPEYPWMINDLLMNNEEDNVMADIQVERELERYLQTIRDEQTMHLGEMDAQVPTTLQTTDPGCQVVERDCCQIHSLSANDDVLMNDEGNMAREPGQTSVRDGLQHVAAQTGGDVFPTSKHLGEAFEENKNVIWSWLMNKEVSLIGIYGMGGVGKTTLVKHIHNQLLRKPDKYHHVYWITVSQDFSIHKLQNLIAKRIGLDLANEDDEMHRAAKLSKALAGRQNYVLILDDLWNHFEPEQMGIPSKMAGCKLILTTRSLEVCRGMGCQRYVIKVQPLLKEEAWNLFKMELGNYDIKLEHLAKSVAEECDGLPLGIKTMARSMREVCDECEWRTALVELKESRVRQRDMEPQVFRILKFSYLHLDDSALQQCFLSCALFPEDFEIERGKLIDFLIAERIIKGRKSRQADLNKGHEMLNRLENACLLERVIRMCGRKHFVKMHD